MIKKEFVKNAIGVSAVSLLMSVLGVLFRTYASNRAGSEAMGLLQLVLSVYYPACTLASSGVYVASTRLCAEALARKHRSVGRIVTGCIVYGLLFGTAAFLLLFFGAAPVARFWLRFPEAEIPLKILAFSLPFLSAANALQGFFLSLRKASYSTVLQVTEDLSKIGATVILFTLFLKYGPHAALCAMVAGMAVGEIVSCLWGYGLYRHKIKDCPDGGKGNTPGIFGEIAKIALPCAFSGYLRSAIGMTENVLVPRGLEAWGLTQEQTLAALGKFEGMALPVLVFPATFLAVVSKLLVPEITAENALGNTTNNIKTINTVLKNTMIYAVFIGCFALIFGKETGLALYGDETCGRYLTVLAPMVPILYGDRVIDGIMKGYDKQLTTMKINLLDSLLQTAGAWLLIPVTGIGGYIGIFCTGTALNFVLSFLSLKRTCGIRFPFREGIFQPVCKAIIALTPWRVLSKTAGLSPWVCLPLSALSYGILVLWPQIKKPGKIKYPTSLFPRKRGSSDTERRTAP